MTDLGNTTGMSTKDLLVQLHAAVSEVDKKVDAARESQIRTETILSEGKFGERITALEAFKNRAEGASALAKWALGGSGVALVLSLLNAFGVLHN